MDKDKGIRDSLVLVQMGEKRSNWAGKRLLVKVDLSNPNLNQEAVKPGCYGICALRIGRAWTQWLK